MGLPSHIARYDSVDLPEFDLLELHLSRPPRGARLLAWPKLRSTEIGLLAFDWLVHVVRQPGHCVQPVDYLGSAFLLSFEATLQFLKDERGKELPGGFDKWLEAHGSYTLTCRGLRTARHLEAHVRPGQLSAQHRRTGRSGFAAGADPGQTVAWQFPPIAEHEYDRVKYPKLSPQQLPEWNVLGRVRKEGVLVLVRRESV